MSIPAPTPTPTPVSAPSGGTYYIYAQGPGVFLEFADGAEGTNLTTWQYTGDTSQQWQVSGNSSTFYTFQNVRYGTYISYTSSATYLTASQTQYDWYIEAIRGGYIFSPNPSYSSFWNVDDGFTNNNNPVILYPGGNIWMFNSAISNQSSSITSSTITGSSSSSSTTGSSANFSSSSGLPGTFTTSASQSGGGDEGNKISLGVGIGIGIPSFIVATISMYFAFLAIRRRLHGS